MIKVQLHVEEAQDLTMAINAYLMVQQQYPDQQTGKVGAVKLPVGGKTFTVIRMSESYTVRGETSA